MVLADPPGPRPPCGRPALAGRLASFCVVGSPSSLQKCRPLPAGCPRSRALRDGLLEICPHAFLRSAPYQFLRLSRQLFLLAIRGPHRSTAHLAASLGAAA